MARAALPSGRQGMEAWLAQPGNAASRATWEDILELAARARLDNEANGARLALHLQHTRQALEVLLGDSAAGGTYGADGQRSAGGPSRRLGSA